MDLIAPTQLPDELENHSMFSIEFQMGILLDIISNGMRAGSSFFCDRAGNEWFRSGEILKTLN